MIVFEICSHYYPLKGNYQEKRYSRLKEHILKPTNHYFVFFKNTHIVGISALM